MDIVIHYGIPKTGSTFVQGILRSNAGLLEAQGVTYPKSASEVRGGTGNAEFLLQHLSSDNYNAAINNLMESLIVAKKWKGMILSSENIATLSTDKIRRLLGWASGRSGRLLLIGSRHKSFEEFAKRSYSQAVKACKEISSLEDYIATHGHDLRHVYRLPEYLAEHAAEFGAILQDIEYSALTGERILAEICQFFNIALPLDVAGGDIRSSSPTQNPSIPAWAVDYYRLLNLLSLDLIHPSSCRVALDDLINRLTAGLAPNTRDALPNLGQISDESCFLIANLLRLSMTTLDGYRDCLAEAASIIQAHLSSVQPRESFAGAIPDGFDPAIYLLINHDVLYSRMNPYEHYLRYGKHEGRSFLIDS